jgi:hypothetical protein
MFVLLSRRLPIVVVNVVTGNGASSFFAIDPFAHAFWTAFSGVADGSAA